MSVRDSAPPRQAGPPQDLYLSEIRRQGVAVIVYLMNGFQLRGTVRGFDSFTILLEYERKTHLVYKHAISTITPSDPLVLSFLDGEAPA